MSTCVFCGSRTDEQHGPGCPEWKRLALSWQAVAKELERTLDDYRHAEHLRLRSEP